jgi:hypothetical protein
MFTVVVGGGVGGRIYGPDPEQHVDNQRHGEADQSREPLFLEISHQAVGGRDPVIAIHEGVVRCDPAAGLSIVINLAQIFKEVRTSDR